MKKNALIFVLITILSIILTACSDQDMGEKQSSSPAKETVFTPSNKYNNELTGVTLSIGTASSDLAQSILVAAGLDNTPYKVDYHQLRGGNLVLEAIAAGQIDAGSGSQIPPIFASLSKNGGNFKIIAIRKGNTLNQELIVSPQAKDSIKTVADLKGKKVAYVKNTTAQYFLYKMLTDAGLKWEDIDSLPMTTSDGLSAVVTGDVDALASYDQSIIQAKENGAVTLRSAEDVLSGDFYWYAAFNTINDPAKHAALVDYLERINEADEWARQHPDEWAQAYAKETNQKVEDYKRIFEAGEKQRKGRIAPVDSATIASEQDIIDSFYKLGALKQNIDAASLFDRSFDKEISNFKVY
ncbi:ABC transporter substrate-binding protein [Pectinatus haikarae]|uniref:Sulfonate transport system substrate-binding protein n=1 Tax=Pectinatus haikarae TaxID=349096 RepID=A0ABT9YAA9_9FIRM|nr:ABC transporter substrate-binding protein [Pectinatus haikarae]MDQ0204771.1 sulfonate transport system substrate-binding protein [Pectinatus haikarae]